ncbi:MAG: ADP-ribosylation factor-directed GTPase activating protein isoform b [Pirellulales bacterium]
MSKLANGSAGVSGAKPPDGEALRQRLDKLIELNGRRHMSPQVNNAWQIVHGMLAYGYDLQLNDNGKLVPGIEWLFGGGQMRGWQLVPGEKGLKDVEEPGSKSGEGHDDQWLGYFAQCGVPLDAEIKVQGQEFTVNDLVTQAQWDVREGMEATWTLMAFSVYLPLDAKWQARDGSEWSIERLLEMECAQDLASSTCGGTHRMYGVASTLNRHLAEGGELKGVWQVADQKIKQAIEDAHANQQPDGGFSINYFGRSSSSPDVGLRINTTGHVLEFVCLASSESQVQQPWVTRAVTFLSDLLEQTADVPVECGGLYHALHGLMLYRDRRFGRE